MQQQEYLLKQQANPREQNMEGVLERELEEGEELLWFGQPSTQSRNRPAPTRLFTILAAIFGSIGLALLIPGIIFLAVLEFFDAGLPLTIIGGTFLLLSLIYTICAITLRFPLKNTLYAITDQRIIVLTTGRNTIVDSYSKKDIGPITRVEQADGVGDLFFTSQQGGYGYNYSYNYNYNGTSSSSNSNSTGNNWNRGMNKGKFIGVPAVREVERLIRRTFLQDHQDAPRATKQSDNREYGDYHEQL